MRVLLINTNREKSPHTLVPLGVCCVASATEAAGHDVRVLDLCFESNPAATVEQTATDYKPDAAGFSIRNLDNCDYTRPRSYLPEVRELIRACKQSCGAEIIIGGPAVSQAPEELCRYLECRYAIAGEGERALPQLLRALEHGWSPAGIPGVSIAEGDTAGTATPVPIGDLASLRAPDPSRWLALHNYAAYGASMPLQTKRGCTLGCSYCVYPLIEGRQWRLREPEWVAEQVKLAQGSGLRMVEFVDSVFGLPREHAVECCEAIGRAGCRIPLSTMDLNPSACSPELTGAMNAAGFSAVGISAESGSGTMLKALGKNYGSEELRSASKQLRKLNATKLWVFMIGAPGETEATLRETAGFIGDLPHSDLVLVTHGIRVLPGTALHRGLVERGEVDPAKSLIDPVFYYSPEITAERAGQILLGSRFPRSNMVTLTDGGHRLIPLLQRVMASLGIKPPYWRYMPIINKARRILRI